jgi:thiol-disulfide isomerase/thioredoxin
MTARTRLLFSLALALSTACFDAKGDDDDDDDLSSDETDGGDSADGSDGSDGDGDGADDAPACDLRDNGWPDVQLPDDYVAGWPRHRDYRDELFYEFDGISDQHGSDDVEIGQFYGGMVLVAIGAEWCPPCQEAAATSQELMDDINADDPNINFVTIEFMLQDRNGRPAGVDVAERWARGYDIDYPVLVGNDLSVISYRIGTNSLPTLVVLDPALEVRSIIAGFPGDAAVRNTVEDGFADFLDENPEWEPTCPDLW